MKGKQTALFEDRFLESLAGLSIIKDPKVAIMELIANSWDAGALNVQIFWPLENGDRFSILDNGHGMTEANFEKRFRTLAYSRATHQGLYAEIPKDNIHNAKRPVFGRKRNNTTHRTFFLKTSSSSFKNKEEFHSFFNGLFKQGVEEMLQAELDEHLV